LAALLAARGKRSLMAWTEPKDITARIQKLWDKGAILREAILPSDLFPLSIKLSGPTSAELGQRFAEADAWIARLVAGSKEQLGYGYTLEFSERTSRLSGSNTLPVRAVVDNVGDALKLLRKDEAFIGFTAFASLLLTTFPDAGDDLADWLGRYPFKALDNLKDAERFLAVLSWFRRNPNSGLYLRQLDIAKVDTKFIERNRGLLTELLRLVLPGHQQGSDAGTGVGAGGFEQEFGLRRKPVTMRFRVLDDALAIGGMTDIQLPIEQFAGLGLGSSKKHGARTAFITENEVNGLSLPSVPRAIAIFGLGYGVDLLAGVPWLRDLDIYYWGDIDTHGFAMLSMVRGFLPQTVSLLMDEKTLLANKKLWVDEAKPFKGELVNLTDTEQQVFRSLCDDTYGKGVRLEQERIPFQSVLDAIASL